MPQQAAGDPERLSAEVETGKQIIQNVVIVSSVESDFMGAARLRQGANNIERLIAIERRDLNRDHIFDLNELRQNS